MIAKRMSPFQIQQKTVSEDSEPWKFRKDDSDETSFHLKTGSGVLSYKANNNNSYTDFLRVSLTMLLAFNNNEVDPEFKKLMQQALTAYEHGASLVSEYDDDDADFVAAAFASAQSEAARMEDATKFTSNLPQADKYRLQILSLESEDSTNVERILAKKTDFPPPMVHDIVAECKPFILSGEQAKDIYVQLRMLDVMVNIKALTKNDEIVSPTVKKVAAKKGSTTRKSTRRNSRSKKTDLTGLEKLPRDEGIITK